VTTLRWQFLLPEAATALQYLQRVVQVLTVPVDVVGE